MDVEVVYEKLKELAAQSMVRSLRGYEVTELADSFLALDQWLARGGVGPREWRTDWQATARKLMTAEGARQILDETDPARLTSLGEQPHDPADCFAHRGRPHLGPCMDAEAYTRWYWTEGPGAEPIAVEQIAKATQRLVREAYAAREQRQLWLQRADEYPESPHADA